MLKEHTMEMIRNLKNLEDLMAKFTVDADTFKYMDANSMELFKTSFKIMDDCCNLMEDYAAMIDNQNKKIDQILDILKKDKA